jgi:integrase
MKDLPRGVRIRRGKLEINYQYDGTQRFETLPLSPSKRGIEEAVRIRRERLEQLKYGIAIVSAPASGVPFSEVAQACLDHARDAREDDRFKLQLSTRNSYRDALNKYWVPYLQKPIGAIRAEDLTGIDEATDWPSRKTRRNAFSAVRGVFAFAMHTKGGKLITVNPAAGLTTAEGRKIKRRPDPQPYEPEERDALLGELKRTATKTAYVFYLVAFYSGMRTGELLALTWPKYDGHSFVVDTARVRREIKCTKTEESRRVLLPDFVCKEVNALPSRFKREWVFVNQYGRPYLSAYHLNRVLETAHEAVGLRRREGPYPWRHTYASIGLTNGAKPAFLAKQLGHTLQVFFSTYARWISGDGDREELEKAVGKLGQNLAEVNFEQKT